MTDIEQIEQEIDWFMGDKENEAILVKHIPDLLAEVKRLREENERLHEAIRGCDSHKCTWLYEENEKQNNVLTTLDEMIQRSEEHVELMKALEQGLGLPETWKEMIE